MSGSAGKPDFVARGMGGCIELFPGELRILRDGYVGFLADLFWVANGAFEKRIPFAQIAAIEIVRPMILPGYIRISYAGGPPQSGHYLEDALGENALIMNPFDHRAFYELQDRVFGVKTAAKGSDDIRPSAPKPSPAPVPVPAVAPAL